MKTRGKQMFPWSKGGEGEGLSAQKQEQGVVSSRASLRACMALRTIGGHW